MQTTPLINVRAHTRSRPSRYLTAEDHAAIAAEVTADRHADIRSDLDTMRRMIESGTPSGYISPYAGRVERATGVPQAIILAGVAAIVADADAYAFRGW